MSKKYIVVTGGAGFVGSNLIKRLIKNKKIIILSLDNYSSGKISNHIRSSRVKYIKGDIRNINKIFKKYQKYINTIFHFGEFSRIFQSFSKFNDCLESNLTGTQKVFSFCLNNRIRLIYSATSASLGNNGDDKNLSPYAFTKAKNLELLNNLKKWFNFKFEVIYFYNVYGPNQICKGDMATVIGIFENLKKKNLPLTVVRPGTQSRRFTHIDDTIEVCLKAWKEKKSRHYSISNKKCYSIKTVAKMFDQKINYLPQRMGERYASALTLKSLQNKVYNKFGKTDLKDYVKKFLEEIRER